MRCSRPVDSGAYVLGALTPTDRAGYERHLATCAECRDEVAELAVLPGLLSRLDAETAVALAEPPQRAPRSILTRTLAAASASRIRERRRHRWALAGTGLVAAFLAVLLGIGATTVVTGGSRPPTQPVVAQMTPSSADDGIIALVGYSPAPGGGTDIKVLCLYQRSAGYDNPLDVNLVVYAQGSSTPAWVSKWQVGTSPSDDANGKIFLGHSPLAPGDIDQFVLTNDVGVTLLWYKTT
jgi:predicted anti-sigma-YlaC factor YlaD